MKPEAVTAAQTALGRAQAAVASMEPFGVHPTERDMARVLECWSDLLAYGNRVYGKLEQGAKRGPAESWFRDLKTERSADPLLRYLHEARNADDHGISAIALPEHRAQIADLSGGKGALLVSLSGRASDLEIMPGPNVKRVVALLPIVARSGKIEVPNEHLGKLIPDSTPLTLGRLFVVRLEQIIGEARSWATM